MKSYCAQNEPFTNPDLWRWRLVHSDENELTGFVQFNIGNLRALTFFSEESRIRLIAFSLRRPF